MAGAHDEAAKFKSELTSWSEEELLQKRSSFLVTLNRRLSLPDGGRKLRVQLQLIDELIEERKESSARFLVRPLAPSRCCDEGLHCRAAAVCLSFAHSTSLQGAFEGGGAAAKRGAPEARLSPNKSDTLPQAAQAAALAAIRRDQESHGTKMLAAANGKGSLNLVRPERLGSIHGPPRNAFDALKSACSSRASSYSHSLAFLSVSPGRERRRGASRGGPHTRRRQSRRRSGLWRRRQKRRRRGGNRRRHPRPAQQPWQNREVRVHQRCCSTSRH